MTPEASRRVLQFIAPGREPGDVRLRMDDVMALALEWLELRAALSMIHADLLTHSSLYCGQPMCRAAERLLGDCK